MVDFLPIVISLFFPRGGQTELFTNSLGYRNGNWIFVNACEFHFFAGMEIWMFVNACEFQIFLCIPVALAVFCKMYIKLFGLLS